jgi:hypothetical protein
MVGNAHDDVAVNHHLVRLQLHDRRVVVRPTPGVHDRATLGLDILAALGKDSLPLLRDKLTALAWDLAAAWLTGQAIADLVIDRAHRLRPDRIADLTEMASACGARLWLVWGPSTPTDRSRALAVTGPDTLHIDHTELPALLPAVPTTPDLPRPTPDPDWPALPTADFTTFLAACYRQLSEADFARVYTAFLTAWDQTCAWIDRPPASGLLRTTTNTSRPSPQFITELIRWLRDDFLGPSPIPAEALIRLRAAQASLLRRAVLLRWQPAALAPHPAARLPHDLTAEVIRHLHLWCRTDIPALLALTVYLREPPATYPRTLHLADLSPDGKTLTLPERATHVRVPPQARTLLAAHHALRRRQGAADDDLLFTDLSQPASPVNPTHFFLQIETALWALHIDTHALTAPGCPHNHRGPGNTGWLGHRQLSVHLLPRTCQVATTWDYEEPYL